ncbi:ABC transporter ATP-binding protein [Cellulomonas hominis]
MPGNETSAPAVEVTALVKRYDGRAVVDGLHLTARAGRVTAVLGPNGAGKTTTVECCEGLRQPDGGRVRVLGLDPVADARLLRPRVGVMLQDGGLPTGVRALEMLQHVARMYARPRDVAELTARLGIDAFGRTTVRRLSGGQRQRLALAAAVVGRPDVVFLDEPSAGLDPQARLAVWALVRELRAEGVTVVLTTHHMDEAEGLADHVVIVDHGTVIAQGSVAELVAAGPPDGPRGSAGTTGLGTGADAGVAGPDGGVDRTLRFRTVPGLDLTDLGAALSGASGTPLGVEELAAGDYAATGPVGPTTVAALADWCARRDVLATSITVGRRTLEDVFLDLTGRSLR